MFFLVFPPHPSVLFATVNSTATLSPPPHPAESSGGEIYVKKTSIYVVNGSIPGRRR